MIRSALIWEGVATRQCPVRQPIDQRPYHLVPLVLEAIFLQLRS